MTGANFFNQIPFLGWMPINIEPVHPVHEFINFKFKLEFSIEAQRETMDAIGRVLTPCPGLIRREYFYAEAEGRWLTHLTWEDEDAIEASADVADDPLAMELFEQIDLNTMFYGRYREAGVTEPVRTTTAAG
jgi:hypothetical protein